MIGSEMKTFAELTEREILAGALASGEEDGAHAGQTHRWNFAAAMHILDLAH
ncbi:hypothetical protein [Tardiphaga sp.]|uniref:hypothetical protein n=1 Tax=Tardiphaga sp. TaxID=1926292 RepID=UPI002629500E|nr:hypothetical protein [Tardiphaga sp.]